MAPKLRNQWLSFPGMVALKVRTGGSERAVIINHLLEKLVAFMWDNEMFDLGRRCENSNKIR